MVWWVDNHWSCDGYTFPISLHSMLLLMGLVDGQGNFNLHYPFAVLSVYQT